MSFYVHRIVQDSANADQVRAEMSVQEKVARPKDDAVLGARSFPAMA
jgi:hypothetical protein